LFYEEANKESRLKAKWEKYKKKKKKKKLKDQGKGIKPEEEELKRRKSCYFEGAEDQQIEAISHFPETFRCRCCCCCYQKMSTVFDDEISAFPFRCSYHTLPLPLSVSVFL
jgi:hypothetical protein